ncbi:MAG: PD40 domain-containing protein [Bacteroidales bacterium]|nr:PD40 domain-containing protein [Bacteroidales bacterium]MBN2819920.1 PD40 domain-containing protein [Bacteroidales bacterium]
MKNILILIYLASTIVACSKKKVNTSTYLGLQPPAVVSQKFAPGIISTENEYEFGISINRAANKIYYAVRLNENWDAEIRCTEFIHDKWTKPGRLDLDSNFSYNDPFISLDEQKLYFMSNRPCTDTGKAKDSNLWYISKTETGWTKPENLGPRVNSEKDEFYPSISNSGKLYFASNIHTITEEDKWNFDIYYSAIEKGKYQKPMRLGEEINSKYFECDAFIAPDESYIIFCSSRPGGYGEGDLYISFRDEEGNWTKAQNAGDKINTEGHEFCPFVSKDGKYFFYSSAGDIFWVSTIFIKKLREE